MLSLVLRKVGLGRIAHNAVLNTLWQLARIALQALWLVVMARALRSSGFGEFAGLAGLAAPLGGLAGLGTGYLLLQNVSRDRSALDRYWRKSIQTTSVSGLTLCIAYVAIAHLLLGRHTNLLAITAIGLSELIFVPLLYVGSFALQSYERLGWSGLVVALIAGSRLLAICLFWWLGSNGGLDGYVWFHLGASALSMVVMFVLVKRLLEPKKAHYWFPPNERREGAKYAAAWSTSSATTDLDKALVLHLSGSEATGIYSVAYRLASILTLPIASLLLAAQPRLFRSTSLPASGRTSFVSSLVLACTGFGTVAAVFLWVLSIALPTILGTEYAMASEVAKLLMFFPPLYALHLVGSSVLMTSGRQLARISAESAGALIMASLAFSLVPKYGVYAMAIIAVVTEAILATAIWALIMATGAGKQALPPGRRKFSDP